MELVFNDTDFVMTQNGDQFSFHGEIGDKTGSNLIIDTEKDTVSFDRPKSFLVGKQNDMDTDLGVVQYYGYLQGDFVLL